MISMTRRSVARRQRRGEAAASRARGGTCTLQPFDVLADRAFALRERVRVEELLDVARRRSSSSNHCTPSTMRTTRFDGKRSTNVSQWSRTNAHAYAPWSRLRSARCSRNGALWRAHLVGGREVERALHERLRSGTARASTGSAAVPAACSPCRNRSTNASKSSSVPWCDTIETHAATTSASTSAPSASACVVHLAGARDRLLVVGDGAERVEHHGAQFAVAAALAGARFPAELAATAVRAGRRPPRANRARGRRRRRTARGTAAGRRARATRSGRVRPAKRRQNATNSAAPA